ncbi:MAG TPA: transketolase family protein [Firmicutes bacterium]|nr:transketolase family protein [Bacillota bacterium]
MALTGTARWTYELTRKAYGETLVELGHENPRVVVLDADLAESTFTKMFRAEFPGRFFEMGIAEQDMVGTAAGLALQGFIPYLSSYAIFITGRAFDQCRQDVDYMNTNVKLAAAHGGISVGKDGPTHQSMEDLACMCACTNMTVLVPADYHETKKAVRWASEYEGPVYFRLGREKVPMVTDENSPFERGKGYIHIDGTDGTIIACGLMLSAAVEAREQLEEEHGIKPRVVNMPFLKPIDEELIEKCARETGAIVTAEEHQIYGGLGSIVARVVVEKHPVPMRIVGIPNMYLGSGDPEDLLSIAGLTGKNIASKMMEILK